MRVEVTNVTMTERLRTYISLLIFDLYYKYFNMNFTVDSRRSFQRKLVKNNS